MGKIFEIRTKRLLLKPLAEHDLDALQKLWTDSQVRRYLWDDEAISLRHTDEIIRKSRTLFASHGYGLWGAFPASGGPLTGFGGFWHFHQPPQLELIYGIQSGQWGRGLASELAGALIRYGFDELGFGRIQASTDPPNRASWRVMEKVGMSFQERKAIAGKDTVFYSISK